MSETNVSARRFKLVFLVHDMDNKCEVVTPRQIILELDKADTEIDPAVLALFKADELTNDRRVIFSKGYERLSDDIVASHVMMWRFVRDSIIRHMLGLPLNDPPREFAKRI